MRLDEDPAWLLPEKRSKIVFDAHSDGFRSRLRRKPGGSVGIACIFGVSDVAHAAHCKLMQRVRSRLKTECCA